MPWAGRRGADALASMRMRFDVPDAAPTEKLNRIVWRSVKGIREPYPANQAGRVRAIVN